MCLGSVLFMRSRELAASSKGVFWTSSLGNGSPNQKGFPPKWILFFPPQLTQP